MQDNSDFLLIPHDRIGAIIGKNGVTKKKIARLTKTELVVDGKEGEVEVIQKGEAIGFLLAMNIIKAIGRGFSPERAFDLLKENKSLHVMDVRDIIGKNKSALTAKKGRVIGSEGKAREEIEKDTGAKLSVYGKTISIIGSDEEIAKAEKAVKMLLGGASHDATFQRLKKRQVEKFEL